MEKESRLKWNSSKNKSIISNESDLRFNLKIDEGNNMDRFTREQSIISSNSTTAVINPLKSNISFDSSLSTINVSTNLNDHHKTLSRRNTVQPLLKKPLNNAPTTSIKPLILPAPTSDSFSQHSKSNIVSLHNTHPSSSISTPFNCQQPMAMGIATIQPQHFGYQNLSNNRYPMIPMSIQNSYPTQQLTLTNGGLGTTVQLMPVMNQQNNQMNNSRMQSLPLFMAPIIGSHGGMLFQPNMTIMPQSSNAMQTFNIANTNYSTDFNQCQSLLSQTITPTRHMPIAMPSEFDSSFVAKSQSDLRLDSTVNSVTSVVTVNEETVQQSTQSSSQSVCDAVFSTRQNVKQRGLIRTQIYRMNQLMDEETNNNNINNIREGSLESPAPPESFDSHEDHTEISLINIEDEKNDAQENDEIANDLSKLPVEPESVSICVPSATVDNSPVSCSINSQSSTNEKLIETKSFPVSLTISNKRKLPSPEILDGEQPLKISRYLNDCHKPESDRKSPGSLFDKMSQVIPERKNEILQNNKSNKLTAVVRPEQRKMLIHYLDDLIIFESDEPFPTTNKMQVVKSALKAGNIKLNPQKSKLLNDQYVFLGSEEEISPSNHKQKIDKTMSPALKSTSFLEPLTVDIPVTTTTASSSCGSLDSSQVRPLSVCSYQSTLPATIVSRKPSMENISPIKETPKVKEKHDCSKKLESVKETTKIQQHQQKQILVEDKTKTIDTAKLTTTTTVASAVANTIKEPPAVKIVSPVKCHSKELQSSEKAGLERPVCDWSVHDVSDFVKQTPGCENYVSLFQNHEIDGEALLLLSKDNLIQGALNMKIGPALKLCARIEKRKALDPQ